jgi:hypothetical protein
VAAFLFVLTVPVQADEVLLTNGDKITGKIVRMEGEKVVLNTDYAGEISIQADKVSRLVTDAPVPATLLDGTRVEGTQFSAVTSPAGTESVPPGDEKGINLAEVQTINVAPKPRIGIKARANAGITNERGNTDTDQYHLDAELVARTEKQRFTVGGEFNKEKAGGIETVENWKGIGKYDYFFRPKWFLYGSSLFEHDEFADLDLRTTLGAGVGHQFFEFEQLADQHEPGTTDSAG